jgi:hypothetical protein
VISPPRTVPRSSSHHETVTPSPSPRGSRAIDAVAPVRAPSPSASHTLEAMPPPPPVLPQVARKVEVIAVPPEAMFQEPPEPAVEPASPGAATRPGSRTRTAVRLTLLMIALGAAATAVAYYWPDLAG